MRSFKIPEERIFLDDVGGNKDLILKYTQMKGRLSRNLDILSIKSLRI